MTKPIVLRVRTTKRVTEEKPNEETAYIVLLKVEGMGEILIDGRMKLKSNSQLLHELIGQDEFEIVFKTPQTKLA